MASCWNHCPGAVASSDTSWVRRDPWRLQSVGGRWWMVMAAAALVSGHIYAGLLAWQGEVGNGWSARGSVQCVTGAQLAAGAQDRVQVRMGGAGLAGEGGGALQSQAQLQQEPGALFLEQRQALRGREQERGGDHRHWNTGMGRRGGRTPAAIWAAATGAGTLPREHLSPGPRVSWPRSPRPPPIQRPASSRPGSPGNH